MGITPSVFYRRSLFNNFSLMLQLSDQLTLEAHNCTVVWGSTLNKSQSWNLRPQKIAFCYSISKNRIIDEYNKCVLCKYREVNLHRQRGPRALRPREHAEKTLWPSCWQNLCARIQLCNSESELWGELGQARNGCRQQQGWWLTLWVCWAMLNKWTRRVKP